MKNFVPLLASEYGLTVTDVQQIKGIAANPVYSAETSKDKLFIKVVSKSRPANEEVYSARLQLLQDLANENVPVPSLKETLDGRLYVPTEDNFMEVYPFIPNGEFYSGHPGQVGQIAQAMARFHSVADKLKERPYFSVLEQSPSPFGAIAPITAEEIAEYQSLVHLLPKSVRGFIAYCLDVLKERTDDILREVTKIREKAQDVGIVHGDLHDQNVMMDKNTKNLMALVDWEGTHGRSRGFDIAYTLERLAVTPSPSHLYDTSFPFNQVGFNKKKIDKFLESYDQERTIDKALKAEFIPELQMEAVARGSKFLHSLFEGLQDKKEVDVNWLHLVLRIQTPARFDALNDFFMKTV